MQEQSGWSGEISSAVLRLGVCHDATARRVALIVNGERLREMTVGLSNDEPDFWAEVDLAAWMGQQLEIHIDPPLPDAAICWAQQPARHQDEDHRDRPQFHFTPRVGWLNDPNGLVYHQGLYHLYFQHNPYGWSHGNIHWGHATSPDLLHWTQHPEAIYPHRFGDRAFSGSAVVDHQNTAGFQTGDNPPIVAAYTSTARGECIVYSNDGGMTFTEYEGNPVLKHKGRDPRLLWYAPGRHWVMAVYTERDSARGIAFHRSTDLKHWRETSWIPGFYECPDLFELPLDDQQDQTRWVLHGGAGHYVIGDFNGEVFTPGTSRIPLAWSDDWYAAQTFTDAAVGSHRRIQIAWARSATPGMPFNQAMFFPVELRLATTPMGSRIVVQPVSEIQRLRLTTREVAPGLYDLQTNPLEGIQGELLDIETELTVGDADEIRFYLRGVMVTYHHCRGLLQCGGQAAPLQPIEGKIRLRMLVDRTTIEIFGNDGLVYLPTAAKVTPGDHVLKMGARHTGLSINRLVVHELASIWSS